MDCVKPNPIPHADLDATDETFNANSVPDCNSRNGAKKGQLEFQRTILMESFGYKTPYGLFF